MATRSNESAPKSGARPGTAKRFLSEIVAIIRLALPISISRLGGLLLVVVDVAMLGHIDAVELAYYGLASSLVMVLFLIGVGMLIGVAVMTAQARGAGRERECGTIWRVGLVHAVVMGAVFILVSLAGGTLFRAIGQAPDLAAGSAKVLIALSLGLPGMLLFLGSTIFLEAIGRPRPGLVVMFAANFLNYGLNLWLLEGAVHLGLGGAVGAAVATSVTRTIVALVLIVYILRMPEAQRLNLRGPLEGAWQVSARLRRLGYGFGLAQGLESMAFSSLSMMAGLLGATAVAGYQIALNLIALVFMVAVGVATATGVGVAHAVGRQDRAAMIRAGWGGIVTILLFMACVCVVMEALPETLAGAFTDDIAVLAIAIPTVVIAGFMLLADGAQAVLMGTLRGAGDVWVPTAMHLCAFLGVMIPLAWLFAIYFDYGVPGLMAGACVGVSLAALLLGGRFLQISRKPVGTV